ncbi:DUF1345 domain-containing protein [Verticiella sediminum]|uniref:DUF1345 domain-containing protein n=1 Tax=Verticiella sediminum TaxID=1247510 RepID=A0A556AW09_9BURK|nr:DUF1345 domain-containing protein [Verticiella sediminum]TSH97143.1 DUF1345 domain-containing protein [Verticiella sediminum]
MPARFLSLLGRHVAPPRFLLFGLVFVMASIVSASYHDDARVALLIGFDVAATVFLGSTLPLLNDDAATMRRHASLNDANRVVMLTVTAVISIVILIAIGTLIASKAAPHWQGLALIVCTLALAWLFANIVFALHYAHLYYSPNDQGDRGGIDVPGRDTPDYWDFVYFSFTLGMTFQTSDIAIRDAHVRKVALGHTMVGFVFNMGVLAFTVNALGGL